MFGMTGHWEILLILLVVLLIFGPKNLPKLGSAMGGFVKNLRAGKEGRAFDDDDDFEEDVPKPRGKSEEKE